MVAHNQGANGVGARKKVIGLTGNIACGKSAVAAELRRLGAEVVDADAVAHDVMAPHTRVWSDVIEAFGPSIVRPDGQIDRRRLGEIVFRDSAQLRRLEDIVHPPTLVEVKRRAQWSNAPVVVIEAIKLIERGMHRDCDSVWVVTCSRDRQIERLMARNGLTEEQARVRIEAQPRAEEKLRYADVVIDNSGDLDGLRRQVEQGWARLMDLPSASPTSGDGQPNGEST
jgi:dephospho-CoA kinase